MNISGSNDSTTMWPADFSMSANLSIAVNVSTFANASNISVSGSTTGTGFPVYLNSLLVVVLPGLCAHSAAAYCLAADIKRRMPLLKQLLLVLSIVDVLGLCSITIHHVNISFTQTPTTLMCSFNSFFFCFLPLMSGAVTTLMAAERCVKFRAPFWHNINIKTWKTKLPIVITTMLIATVAIFPLSGLGFIISKDGKRCLTFPSSVPKLYSSPEGIYAIAYATVGLGTVVVDISCNIAVIATLKGMKSKRLGREDRTGPEMVMTRMLLYLSATFLITLTPLYVSVIMLFSGKPLSRTVKTITHSLAGLSFTLDPFIYILTIKSYRQRLAHLMCSCCCCKKNKEAPPTSVSSLNQAQVYMSNIPM